MSEGENKAIEILTTYKNQILERKPFTYSFIDMQWAINTILDLYKQEKEKNKELYEIKYVASTFINRPLSQFSIGEFRYQVNNSISKDKIRAKIEEIENGKENYTFKVTSKDIRRTIITNLKNILEE